jgi:Flp pilus assembly protein TadD
MTDDPNNPEADIGLGQVELARHKPELAVADFDAALKKGGDPARVLNDKGIALDYAGRHREAQTCYRQGLSAAPDDHELRNNLGLSLALTGDYKRSIEILTELVQEPDATPRNRQNLALALGLEGDQDDARMVAKRDLDDGAVENNMKFYAAVKATAKPADPSAN